MSRRLSPVLAAALVLAAGLVVSLLAGLEQDRRNRERVDAAFETFAQTLGARIRERVQMYEKGLRGLRGAVLAAGRASVSRRQIKAYSDSRDIDTEFPGARGFGVIWRVPPAEESTFVKRMREEGRDGFVLRQIEAHAGERWVITDADPLYRNAEALGLDIASEARRRAGANDALERGAAALTAPITLMQAQGQARRGFLLLLPVVMPGGGTGPAAASAAAPGWTYAPLLIDEVLADVAAPREHLALQLHDLGDMEAAPFFELGGAVLDQAAEHRLVLNLFGRRWQATARPTQAFADTQNLTSPLHLGLGLAGVSILLAGLAANAVLLVQRGRRERLVAARSAAIIEGSVDAIIGEALDGMVTEWNAGAERLFGYTAAQVVGRPVADFILPADRRDEDARIRACVGRGEIVQPYHTTRLDARGTLIEVSVSAAPMFVDGRCVGFAKIVRDIRAFQAAQRQLEDVQREQQALLKTLDRHSIVSVADRQGNIVTVNDAFCEISGYTRAELVGRNHRIVNSGFHPLEFWVDMWRTLGSGRAWRAEVCNRAKDGSLYWVDSIVTPFFDANGRIEKYVSIRTDITDRRRAEEATRGTLRLLQAVLEASTQVSIVATEPGGMVSLFNHGAEKLLQVPAEEVIGKRNVLSLFDRGELQAAAAEASARLGRTVSPTTVLVEPELLDTVREISYVRADGALVPVALGITAMYDEFGTVLGYLGVAHDLTARRNYEVSLQRAVEEARRANEAKGRFLANMSHEIRTPLNAVIGLTHILGRGALDVEQADTVGKIRLAGQALLELINDVLDVSKIEAGALRLERAAFGLGRLFTDLASMLGPQAEAKGVALQLDLPPGAMPVVIGDAARLRQVLVNLLSNALKFTEHGQVRLQVENLPGPRESVRLRCTVRDSGIGIAPDAKARLFAPFAQADESTTRRFGGTGLGLSIVKQILALMDSEIHVDSMLGQGSAFWFELTLPLAERQVEEVNEELAEGAEHLAGVRVLVADDNEINREVARRLLESEGAWVVLADNGLAAVQGVAQADPPLDIVLMDVHMPLLDGNEAARRIRRLPDVGRVPIIALTADMSLDEQTLARDAGMNAVIGKPFGVAQLVGSIRRNLAQPPAVRPAAQRPASHDADWPSIVGIDGADARARLGGNVALLRRSLRRLLREFDPTPPAPSGLQTLAARMHSFKGSAGMLGARRAEQLAARTEAACRVGNLDAATARLLELSVAVAQLRQAAQAFLEQSDMPRPDAQQDTAQALGADELAALVQQLSRFELDAVDRFGALSPRLLAWLGDHRFATLREHMDNLDFPAAVELIQQGP